MYKKLTYSGTQCNNYLYFSFDAEFFNTENITDELNIQPTSVMIKKEPVPKSTAWKYQINAGNEIDLEKYLAQLIAVFDSKIETINRLKKNYNLKTRIQFVIDIDLNPESSTPYFGLNTKAIDFLEKTRTEIDFDLYKADTIGLLNNLNKK
ncbi:DUF4279 domain-containing protein [bacterium]|nr:DUF4279 domain-containing protein [bacterium]